MAVRLGECDLFQNLLNTSSKIGKSSTLVVSTLRKLRKTSSRSTVSMSCSAVAAVTTSAGVTESPCALSSRQKSTVRSVSKSDIRGNPWQLCLERCNVAFVFQETPKSFGDNLFVQLRCLQRHECVGPIQCLRNAGNLRQAHCSRSLHDLCDLLCKTGLNRRNLRPHNLQFLFERRIIDPVIKTAPSQRVRQVA